MIYLKLIKGGLFSSVLNESGYGVCFELQMSAEDIYGGR